MENLSLPSKIHFEAGENDRLGSIVIEPLWPGYGTTLGNALRRVLLSSLPGAAVTAVRIYNAPHEFTTLPQVQEDILQIILNLKLLRLKSFSAEPVVLKLKAKGETVVKAGDIEPDSNIEIVNPDLKIATLTSRNAEIEMDIWVSQGRGYVPTEAREKEKTEIGTIAIDSLFSPIRSVSFTVEPARVGQMTNFDRLLLNVETDGTIKPMAAIQESTKILLDHFGLLGQTLAEVAPSDEESPIVVDDAGEAEAETPKKRTRKKKATKEDE